MEGRGFLFFKLFDKITWAVADLPTIPQRASVSSYHALSCSGKKTHFYVTTYFFYFAEVYCYIFTIIDEAMTACTIAHALLFKKAFPDISAHAHPNLGHATLLWIAHVWSKAFITWAWTVSCLPSLPSSPLSPVGLIVQRSQENDL